MLRTDARCDIRSASLQERLGRGLSLGSRDLSDSSEGQPERGSDVAIHKDPPDVEKLARAFLQLAEHLAAKEKNR
jgi:hypothetical protein